MQHKAGDLEMITDSKKKKSWIKIQYFIFSPKKQATQN